MSARDEDDDSAGESPDQVFERVSSWISRHDFRPAAAAGAAAAEHAVETNLVDGITDITSVTKNLERGRDDGFVVEERTDVVKCEGGGGGGGSSEEAAAADDPAFIKTLTKFSQYSPFEKRRARTASPSHFSVIVEGEELELPEAKKSDTSFKSFKFQQQQEYVQEQAAPPRPSSRHKRHADALMLSRPSQMEKKTRKRRTLEKLGASVIIRNFLNAFLESTLVGAVLVILDLLLNSNVSPEPPAFSFF